ncbi:uncharacterized protein LOC105902965 isoform X1 [Clupea harengus]|uniref:Uncharacterized protein LOC105902965 isoform X1 n=1 Tax=Clupea harengus TaxID=7950 RepID=A0A6P8FSS3_CLUHA|nr:uncharacterized protein LOC105902965 isoform X1 [Clupea harengus]
MEEEIAELKSRDAELEQLSNTEDHIHFLKTFQSAIDPPQFKDLSNITINQGLSFEAVKKSVSKLKTQLEDFCRKEVMMISAAVSEVQAVCPEPVTRQESFSGMGSAFTLPGFGQQASGTSLFGQPSVTSLFGQPSVTSLFGQANGASTMGTASGTSLFGQASGASTLGTVRLSQNKQGKEKQRKMQRVHSSEEHLYLFHSVDKAAAIPVTKRKGKPAFALCLFWSPGVHSA